MINYRIKKIVELIPKNCKKIVDVGCDHCYLTLAIRKKGINTQIVASDIRKKPLESCQKTCLKYNLKNVSMILSDGLKEIDDDYDVLVIAGMGGKTILEILEKSDHNFANKTLILQSNNAEEKIREFVYKNDLSITKEDIIKEKDNYYYLVVISRKGEKILNKEEVLMGLFFKQKEVSLVVKDYFLQKVSHLQKVLTLVEKKDNNKKLAIEKKILLIKKYLKIINFEKTI